MKNIDRYIKSYYNSLLKDEPKSIEYLDYICDVIVRTLRILNRLNVYPKCEIDVFEEEDTKMIVKILLDSIDKSYLKKYKSFVKKGLVHSTKKDISYMNANGIYMKRTNDVEEMLTSLHEFMHYLHFEKYDNEWTDEFSYSTEMFAMTLDFYGMFYMYQNDILKDDTLKIFLNYINYMYAHAADALEEAHALNIYEKFDSLDFKNREIYSKLKDVLMEPLINIDKIDRSKHYKEEYKYIFGWPLSFYMGNKMAGSEAYKDKFLYNFDKIKASEDAKATK